MEALIAAIISAASSLVTEIIGLFKSGKKAEARAKVERFVAFTKSELEADKQEALDVLNARFGIELDTDRPIRAEATPYDDDEG